MRESIIFDNKELDYSDTRGVRVTPEVFTEKIVKLIGIKYEYEDVMLKLEDAEDILLWVRENK